VNRIDREESQESAAVTRPFIVSSTPEVAIHRFSNCRMRFPHAFGRWSSIMQYAYRSHDVGRWWGNIVLKNLGGIQAPPLWICERHWPAFAGVTAGRRQLNDTLEGVFIGVVRRVASSGGSELQEFSPCRRVWIANATSCLNGMPRPRCSSTVQCA